LKKKKKEKKGKEEEEEDYFKMDLCEIGCKDGE
jgi:hypothetical protein